MALIYFYDATDLDKSQLDTILRKMTSLSLLS